MDAPNGLAPLSDNDLATIVKRCKQGILDLLDMPIEQAMRPRKEGCAAGMLHIKIFFLQGLEDEIKRRGLDPTGEFWGADLLGEIAAIQVDMLTNG